METERKRQLLLAAVAVVLAIVAYQAWPRTSAAPVASSNEAGAAARGTAGRKAPVAGTQPAPNNTPDVHLEALEAERPKPGATDRNLFRFKPKAPPPAPTTKPMPTPPPVALPPPGPPPPPPLPPIPLKFIGLADVGPGKPKVAVLTDGLGPPVSGREGEIIFGRYRILKIGVESIELAYADGRGRQTIRLSGS